MIDLSHVHWWTVLAILSFVWSNGLLVGTVLCVWADKLRRKKLRQYK
jgi:hypothetical protein